MQQKLSAAVVTTTTTKPRCEQRRWCAMITIQQCAQGQWATDHHGPRTLARSREVRREVSHYPE